MKSIVKTALTLSMILPLTGCFDFGWAKKEEKHEAKEVAHHGAAASENSGKCSHKGCTQDHSKDGHKKSRGEVQTQDMDDEEDMDDEDAVIQNMDEESDDDDESMEDYN